MSYAHHLSQSIAEINRDAFIANSVEVGSSRHTRIMTRICEVIEDVIAISNQEEGFVTVFGAVIESDLLGVRWLVLQHDDACKSLDDWCMSRVQQFGTLSLTSLFQFALNTMTNLHLMHSHRLWHGLLSPSSVAVSVNDTGHAKFILTDAGLSKLKTESMKAFGALHASDVFVPTSVSRYQASQSPSPFAGDVFACGVMVGEMALRFVRAPGSAFEVQPFAKFNSNTDLVRFAADRLISAGSREFAEILERACCAATASEVLEQLDASKSAIVTAIPKLTGIEGSYEAVFEVIDRLEPLKAVTADVFAVAASAQSIITDADITAKMDAWVTDAATGAPNLPLVSVLRQLQQAGIAVGQAVELLLSILPELSAQDAAALKHAATPSEADDTIRVRVLTSHGESIEIPVSLTSTVSDVFTVACLAFDFPVDHSTIVYQGRVLRASQPLLQCGMNTTGVTELSLLLDSHFDDFAAGDGASAFGIVCDNGQLITLSAVSVNVKMYGMVAAVELLQEFVNETATDVSSATLSLPLPEGGVIDGLTVVIGSKQVRGMIKPKEVARLQYDKLSAAGQGVTLAETVNDSSSQPCYRIQREC